MKLLQPYRECGYGDSNPAAACTEAEGLTDGGFRRLVATGRVDLLRRPADTVPVGAFDLVSMPYPVPPEAGGDPAVRSLLDTVRPGGSLLAVCHDLDDEHREHMKSWGVDPTEYVGADDLGGLLGDDSTVELHAAEPRIDPRQTPRTSSTPCCAWRR